MSNDWVGRDSNPEPTPKAFGAALTHSDILWSSKQKSRAADSFCVLTRVPTLELASSIAIPARPQLQFPCRSGALCDCHLANVRAFDGQDFQLSRCSSDRRRRVRCKP